MKVPRVAQETAKALEAGLRVATRTAARKRISQASGGSRTNSDVPEASSVEERALFISVKPHFADAILDGRKTVELRRTRPNLPDGSLVILYSSTPTRAVVGWAQLIGVREGTPCEIWDEFGAAAAIAEVDYDTYFDGAAQAFALELNDVVVAYQPVPLSVIRLIGIQPPQSWRYVPASISIQIQEFAVA